MPNIEPHLNDAGADVSPPDPRSALFFDGTNWRVPRIDTDGRLVSKDWIHRIITRGYGFTLEFLILNQANGADAWHRVVNPAASGRDIKLVGVYVLVDGGVGRFEVWFDGTETDGVITAPANLRYGSAVGSIATLYQNDTLIVGAGSLLSYVFDTAAWIPLLFEIEEDNFLRFRIVNTCGAISHTHVYPVWVEF